MSPDEEKRLRVDVLFEPAMTLVREFHIAMELPVSVSLTEESRAEIRGWASRVQEEAKELQEALGEGSSKEILKELIDVIYTALGVAVALGTLPGKSLMRTHVRRMTALGVDDVGSVEDNLPTLHDQSADLFGGATEVVREYYAALKVQSDKSFDSIGSSERSKFLGRMVRDDAFALGTALDRRDQSHVMSIIGRVLHSALTVALALNAPIEAAFQAVHENNMTKRRPGRRKGISQKPVKGDGYETVDLGGFVEEPHGGAL